MKRLVVSVLLVGCGGDGGGSPVAIDDLGMELAVQSCAKLFDCCTDAELMDQFNGITYDGQPISTEDQCVEFANALLSGLAFAEYKESLEMGRIDYDSAAAGDCVAALDELSCSQYSSAAIADISGCRPFIIAKVGDGGGCTEDFECTSGNCVGATESGDTSTDGECKPMPAAGESCDDNCADGLYCTFDTSNGMKVCQPLKADGAQCTLDRDCESDYCDEATDTCATEPPRCDGR